MLKPRRLKSGTRIEIGVIPFSWSTRTVAFEMLNCVILALGFSFRFLEGVLYFTDYGNAEEERNNDVAYNSLLRLIHYFNVL